MIQECYKKLDGKDVIENIYLYVSRKALRIPMLYLCNNLDEFIQYVPANKYLSRIEIFDLLGLDDSFIGEWENSGFKLNDYVFSNELQKNEKFRDFYIAINVRQKKLAKEEYDIFIGYLMKKEFKGKVAVVDIGWAGTIQKCLIKITSQAGIDVNIKGFYVGLTEDAEKTINAEGYIPSRWNPQVSTAGLVEYPFLAREGSLKAMTFNGNDYVPILEEYEYKNCEEGGISVQEMQKGILDGLDALCVWEGNEGIEANIAYLALHRISKHPRLLEARVLGDLIAFDNGYCHYLARPDSILNYIITPKKFVKDLSDSMWKVGFLKRLIKLPLPYATFLEKAKKYCP